MAPTNRDIKKATSFMFKKYEDLIKWYYSKNPQEQVSINAERLLSGVHVYKHGDTVGIAIDWAAGRNQSTPWVVIKTTWGKEVTKELSKLGITPLDIHNAIDNKRVLLNKLKVDKLDKYMYVENSVMRSIIEESTSVEETIKNLIS